MRIPSLLVATASLALALGVAAAPVQAAAPRAELAPVVLPEIPNSVAVADGGVTLASFHDAKQLGVIKADGTLTRIDVSCTPMAVAVAPAGDWGWAVCSDSQHLTAVNLATSEVVSADVGIIDGVALVYSPATKRVAIGTLNGQIIIVSVTSLQDYAVLHSFNVGGSVWAMAAAPDGKTAFTANKVGFIERLDLMAGTAKTLDLRLAVAVTSLSVAPSGNVLYIGGGEMGPTPDDVQSLLLAVDPQSGAVQQRVPLTTALPAFGNLLVAANHRTLYVGSGIGAGIGTPTYGVFGVALDALGRMGSAGPVFGKDVTANALGLSGDGRMLAVGSVNSTLERTTVEDAPHPPAIGISGLYGHTGLEISGRTNGVAAGTTVTIYLKALGTKKAKFVAQKTKAIVGATGSFTWKGRTSAHRVAVYAITGKLKSSTITLSHG